ncbi:MAG: YcaO-like family protein [Candidatus Pacebacteria bacterium]|nr:YcaO-like family protein [Candidatus Paceibacterota bacterium]
MNEKADIFILPGNNIVILSDGKVIKIGGDDTWIITKLFKGLYRNKRYMKELAGILGREKITSDFRKTISELKKLNIIIDIKGNQPSAGSCCIRPFAVFPLQNGIWHFRNREKIYYFLASTYGEAKKKMESILLSCVDDEDLDLLASMGNQITEFLGRQFRIPQGKISAMVYSLKEEDVGIYDMEKDRCRCVKGSFSPCLGSKFWKELEKRAVGETRIVPSLKRVQDNGLPFRKSKIVYLSSHKMTGPDNRVTDLQIGIDTEVEAAKGKAIMEAIERYCGRKPIEENLVFESFFGLDSNSVIDPENLWNFSGYQFSNGWLEDITPFNPTDIIPWIKMQSYLNGENKYAPLSFITYASKMAGNYPFNFMANSNGMAAHTSLDLAVKKGALEVIERDAILIYWLNRISPRRIVIKNHEEYNTLKKNLEELGYQLYLVDLTLDTVPVVMAIAYTEKGTFPFFCGAAAAESKIEAISKAMEELEFTLWSRLKYSRDTKGKVKAVSSQTIINPVDHEALYLKAEMISHLEFFLNGEIHEIGKEELSEKTDLCLSLAKKGLELYYVDMTVSEVKNLNLGIQVVKAIIPGFVPITFGYGKEPLGMRRIYDVPIQLRLKDKRIKEEELITNYLPHFFS